MKITKAIRIAAGQAAWRAANIFIKEKWKWRMDDGDRIPNAKEIEKKILDLIEGYDPETSEITCSGRFRIHVNLLDENRLEIMLALATAKIEDGEQT